MDDTTNRPDYSGIPLDLRDIFEALQSELVWIHGHWNAYRQLFGTSALRIQLLNETAPTFFYQLQVLWFDYVVLEICKITDKPSTGGQQNLVVSLLHCRLDRSQHAALATRLEELLTIVEKACKPLRERRNKKLAHSDLGTAVRAGSPLPGVSRQAIEDALKAVRNYVNAFRLHFLNCEMYFEGFEMGNDPADLLHNLKRAAEYRLLEAGDREYTLRIIQSRWRDA